MAVDIDLGMIVGVEVVVVDQKKTDRDLPVAGDIEDGKKFAEVGSRRLQTDLGRRMFGSRKDLVIAVHKSLQNRPL